jgi:hypothetical protein
MSEKQTAEQTPNRQPHFELLSDGRLLYDNGHLEITLGAEEMAALLQTATVAESTPRTLSELSDRELALLAAYRTGNLRRLAELGIQKADELNPPPTAPMDEMAHTAAQGKALKDGGLTWERIEGQPVDQAAPVTVNVDSEKPASSFDVYNRELFASENIAFSIVAMLFRRQYLTASTLYVESVGPLVADIAESIRQTLTELDGESRRRLAEGRE